jgi:hypothetical protein
MRDFSLFGNRVFGLFLRCDEASEARFRLIALPPAVFRLCVGKRCDSVGNVPLVVHTAA